MNLKYIFCQWWSQAGSNRWPPACKAGALPAELIPRYYKPLGNLKTQMVGLGGVEPPTSRLSGVRSNRTELQAPIQWALLPQNNAIFLKNIFWSFKTK